MEIKVSHKTFNSQRISIFSIVSVILLGLLVLLGWKYRLDFLKRPIPGLVAMNPLTALCFVGTGVAFLFTVTQNAFIRKIKLGKILSILIILASVLKLIGLSPILSWQIDKTLFSGEILYDAERGLISGMAANTAIAFIISGMALLLLNGETRQKRLTAHILVIIVFLFGFFSLLGYLYVVPEFYSVLSYLPMAVHTSIGFMVVSVAFLLIHPNKGITKEFTSDLSGALVGKLLMLCAFCIPIVLGLFRLNASKKMVFSSELGTTLLILSFIIIFCSLIFYIVILLNRKDSLQKEATENLRESEERFRSLVSSVKDYAIFMIDRSGTILTWNEGAEAIKGYSAGEIIGKNISIFYTKEDNEKALPADLLNLAAKQGRVEHEGLRVKKDGTTFWADIIFTALYDSNKALIGFVKVTRDITESKKAKDLLVTFNDELNRQVLEKTVQIEETTTQLRQLHAHLQKAREEERKLISREIHDEMGQMLTGLRMDLTWLRKKTTLEDEAVKLRFERALELLDDLRATMRRVSSMLHPAMLNDLGLIVALESYAKDFEKRSGIKINFLSEIGASNEPLLSSDTTIGVYRVFQESLTNIAKHSDATEVNIFLRRKENELAMMISDNGKGFKMAEVKNKKTLGLIGMRERVLMIEGKYTIQSEPENGTTILLTLPCEFKS